MHFEAFNMVNKWTMGYSLPWCWCMQWGLGLIRLIVIEDTPFFVPLGFMRFVIFIVSVNYERVRGFFFLSRPVR